MRVLVCTDPGVIHSKRFVEGLSNYVNVGLFWQRRPAGQWDEVNTFPKWFPEPIRAIGLRRLTKDIGIASTLAQFRPDIVHVHHTSASLCPQFKRWARRIPVIYTSWGHISQARLEGEHGRDISRSDAFTADAPTLLAELSALPGCRNKPNLLFRFCADRTLFRPTSPTGWLHRQLGIDRSSDLIFSARSLRPGYNHETLVRAIPSILERHPSTHVLFVHNHGHRYPNSADYVRGLKREIESLGVTGHTHFLNHLSYDDVARVMAEVRAVISIPTEDGMPATIFESMACGIPLVVSDLPDYAGVITNGNSIPIEARNSTQLAQAVSLILSDSTRRTALISDGLTTVAVHGDFAAEFKRLVTFYGELMANTSAQH